MTAFPKCKLCDNTGGFPHDVPGIGVICRRCHERFKKWQIARHTWLAVFERASAAALNALLFALWCEAEPQEASEP